MADGVKMHVVNDNIHDVVESGLETHLYKAHALHPCSVGISLSSPHVPFFLSELAGLGDIYWLIQRCLKSVELMSEHGSDAE